MKLNKKDLRHLILKEMQKMEEDYLVYPGAGRDTYYDQQSSYASRQCEQCGTSMYENESSCSECGAMYENSSHKHEHDHKHEHSFHEGACTECGMLEEDAELEEHLNEGFGTMNVKIGNHGHYKGAYMAKSQMYKVAKYAEKLYRMIPDGHNLEDWMRTKLAQISDDISEVYHALEHDIYEGDV